MTNHTRKEPRGRRDGTQGTQHHPPVAQHARNQPPEPPRARSHAPHDNPTTRIDAKASFRAVAEQFCLLGLPLEPGTLWLVGEGGVEPQDPRYQSALIPLPSVQQRHCGRFSAVVGSSNSVRYASRHNGRSSTALQAAATWRSSPRRSVMPPGIPHDLAGLVSEGHNVAAGPLPHAVHFGEGRRSVRVHQQPGGLRPPAYGSRG